MGQFTEQEQKVLRRMARGSRYYEVVARELGLGRDVVRQAARKIFLECSFCEKSHNQVSRLVAGPGVYICNECIELCIEIIEKELSEPSGLQVEEPPTPKRQIDPRTFTEQELQVLKLLTRARARRKSPRRWVRISWVGLSRRYPGSCGGRSVPRTQTSNSRGVTQPCPPLIPLIRAEWLLGSDVAPPGRSPRAAAETRRREQSHTSPATCPTNRHRRLRKARLGAALAGQLP